MDTLQVQREGTPGETCLACRAFPGHRPQHGKMPISSMKVIQDDPSAQLVVLDDGGLDFRNQEALWPAGASGQEKTCLGFTEDGATGCPGAVMEPAGQ